MPFDGLLRAPFNVPGTNEKFLRVDIDAVALTPAFQHIGRIVSSDNLDGIVGTGWLASNSTIVTAAHVLRNHSDAELYFEPILLGFERFKLGDPVYAGSPNGSGIFDDAAMMTLQDGTVDAFIPSIAQPAGLPGDVVVPGFDPSHPNEISYFQGNCVIHDGLLRYALNTVSGHSGSPVMLASDLFSSPVIVGIHVDGPQTDTGLADNSYYQTGIPFPFA